MDSNEDADADPITDTNDNMQDENDPSNVHPDYQPDKILRFSRLIDASIDRGRQAQLYCFSKSYNPKFERKHAQVQQNFEKGIEKPFKSNVLPPPSPGKVYNEYSFNTEEEQDDAQGDGDGEPPAWRFGPSQFWYDRMNVPANPKNFDYGLKKLQEKAQEQERSLFDTESTDEEECQPAEKLPESTFLPVNLTRWKDLVITDVQSARESLMKNFSTGNLPYSGFVPSRSARTYKHFVHLQKNHPTNWFEDTATINEAFLKHTDDVGPDLHHSMFPPENYDLLHTNWEDDIIWDTAELTQAPEPKILTMDYEDDPQLWRIYNENQMTEVVDEYDDIVLEELGVGARLPSESKEIPETAETPSETTLHDACLPRKTINRRKRDPKASGNNGKLPSKSNEVSAHIPRIATIRAADYLLKSRKTIHRPNNNFKVETVFDKSLILESEESCEVAQIPRETTVRDARKSINRRHGDPKIKMASVFKEIFRELRALPDADELMLPVCGKSFPDYYDIVTDPMDMLQISKKIDDNLYKLRIEFLTDFAQMHQNKKTYFGENHEETRAAETILVNAAKRVYANEAELMELEKQINPLLHEDDMVGFSSILDEIVEACKEVRQSSAFYQKVKIQKYPTYYFLVKRPMHFGLISQNIKERKYLTVGQFRRDIEQIKINSEIFNGPQNFFTLKAVEIVNRADELIFSRRGLLTELEANIRNKKRAEGVEVIDDEEFSLKSIIRKFKGDLDSISLSSDDDDDDDDDVDDLIPAKRQCFDENLI